MDTLSPPQPDPVPQTAEGAPGPATASPAPDSLQEPGTSGHGCGTCRRRAVVSWQRRPTDSELADVRGLEEKRRAEAVKLSQPAPDFGPLPTADDVLVAVYACAQHAISLEAAARIHQSGCTAPNEADLPDCDCTPKQLPTSPLEVAPLVELPDHWMPAGQ
ncbi:MULTISPECIES: hypothetical protein [Streptomyces]|uniref:Uncharacterized protein n=1 Tax=Streptomyces doudnae TaxID=3075536 RepID=A0ABD5ELS9_9ACTN|nr:MULTISPECIES: hypothetical protein [unclassified Streptomyces]MDT0435616.1 hypothetical protein [Streptomyces sp. DSM 41981]MYQ62570.1 hypothetical protein [Streptomyces sp. SID4950]SCD40117.1 hypothetical protein GA0115242_104875 [Streptomyces sp. SolWspMP-5a-2]